MGRGKSQKTKVKEAASLSVPLLLAEKQASQKAELKKPWELIAREYAEKVKLNEWMELGAVLGTTFVLASSLEFIKNLAETIRQMGEVIVTFYEGTIGAVIQHYQLPIEPIKESIRKGSLPNLSWTEWLVCFGVAYILVHNAGLIIQAGGNIISAGMKMVGSLGGLAAGAVAA